MFCPFCCAEDTRVVDSRLVSGGNQVRRRRECGKCFERFTTYEEAELMMPRVIKRSGICEPFDEEKLRAGLLRALEKRPIDPTGIEDAIHEIKKQLRLTGERDVHSHVIGEAVIKALLTLDSIAYIRFASVYLKFQDIHTFKKEIDRLIALYP